MLLVAAMVDYGCTMRVLDGEGLPDACAILPDGRRLWVEAVAPTAGAPDNPNSVTDPVYEEGGKPIAATHPTEDIALRIFSSLTAKLSQRAKQVAKGHINETDPYVIAVNPRLIPGAIPGGVLAEMQLALVGMGSPVFVMDVATRRVVDSYREPVTNIQRKPGPRRKDYNTDPRFFLHPAASRVSAVLYSIADTYPRIGLSYPKHDFILIHNGLAEPALRLPVGALPADEEWIVNLSGDGHINITRIA